MRIRTFIVEQPPGDGGDVDGQGVDGPGEDLAAEQLTPAQAGSLAYAVRTASRLTAVMNRIPAVSLGPPAGAAGDTPSGG